MFYIYIKLTPYHRPETHWDFQRSRNLFWSNGEVSETRDFYALWYNQLENTVKGLDSPRAHWRYLLLWASKFTCSKSGTIPRNLVHLKSFLVQSVVVWYSITKCHEDVSDWKFCRVHFKWKDSNIKGNIFSKHLIFLN